MPRMVTAVWHGSVSVLLALNGRQFPGDDEWSDYLRAIGELRLRDPGLERTSALSLSDGGGPTSSQRRMIVEATGGARRLVAIITRSRLVRGIGGALSWFMPELRTFGPDGYRRALRHIRVPDDEEDSLWQAIVEANARIGLEIVAELDRQPGALTGGR